MVSSYCHADWRTFRLKVLALDGQRCVRCFRGPADRVILQVHHKRYLPDRLPWEYDLSDCETLCKGCHAEEHGHIMPRSDWRLLATDDLEDLIGRCELCRTELRYTFAIVHPKWGSMAVGTNCCDRLTRTAEASLFMDQFTKRRDKVARFVGSKRWQEHEAGASSLSQGGASFRIQPDGADFKIVVNGVLGRKTYAGVVEARKHLFEIIESGEAAKFVARQRQKATLGMIEAKRRA